MKYVEEMELACIEKANENESRVRVLDLENDFKKVKINNINNNRNKKDYILLRVIWLDNLNKCKIKNIMS